MSDFKVAILNNEDPASGDKWALACRKLGIVHDRIDITCFDWLDKILSGKYDFFLLKPPGLFENYKKLYDERIYIISKVFGFKIYPSYEECYIYENKKLLSDYLKARNLPCPLSHVFYSLKEALRFITNASFPIVAKTSIGGSGSGVTIIKSKRQAEKYVRKAFSSTGIRRQTGPNRAVGSPSKWLKKAINSPAYLISRLKLYRSIYRSGEKGYVIFQDFIPHDFEWRAVKIGDSFFAHKKIKYKEKASGSKGIDYVNPPFSLLNFVKEICERSDFNFMALDLFEDGKGGYLINELQTIFGHVQDYILEVDGQPGRYLFIDNEWKFEPGDFNTNESYDLRLQTAIKLFSKSKH
ncbi:MAG TPA: hypothetical protein PLS58_03870 [Bacteroidales bacterium]|nr:hypothetical protein [Bacteroidales bacterium]